MRIAALLFAIGFAFPAIAQPLGQDEMPTPDEATRAYVKAKNATGMGWKSANDDAYTVTLVECAKNTDPGIVCIAEITTTVQNAKPFHNKLRFTKSALGEWTATFER